MLPEFSVIIPTYNRESLLRRAIGSVLNQTYPDLELIVADDGSTDGTEKLVKEYQEARYFFQDNRGVCTARNFGAEKATKEWLVFLDSDDELFPSSLAEFADSIKANPQVGLVKSGFLVKNDVLKSTEKRILQKDIYNPPLIGTFAIKRSLFLEIGGYDQRLTYSENTELFYRLSEIGVQPFLLESMSLIYYESPIGGSKNLGNIDQSLSLILSLHSKTMSRKENWNLYQTLGVVQLKLFKFSEARKSLANSIRFKPSSLSTYLRFFIACIPFLSKKIYYPIIANS